MVCIMAFNTARLELFAFYIYSRLGSRCYDRMRSNDMCSCRPRLLDSRDDCRCALENARRPAIPSLVDFDDARCGLSFRDIRYEYPDDGTPSFIGYLCQRALLNSRARSWCGSISTVRES